MNRARRPQRAPRTDRDDAPRYGRAQGVRSLSSGRFRAGDRAPAFTLFNQDHVEVAAAELLQGATGEQLLSRALVTVLHDGAGGLQQSDSEVKGLGGRMVAITPELERYTRGVRKKLNLTFDILTDLHLKVAEEFRLVFVLPDYLRDLYRSFGSTLEPHRLRPVELRVLKCCQPE